VTGTLRVGGQDYPCEAEVRTELRYHLGRRGVKPRVRVPDSILLHWTGAENPASTVHRTLVERNLGVELIIDRAGVVWQTCDPMVLDCADCGGGAWDARSIGIEIVSYGMVAPGAAVPPLGRDRGTDRATLRGRRVEVARFYPQQVSAVLAVIDTLRAALPIPATVPADVTGCVIDRPLSDEEARAWKGGVLGHLHTTTKAKPDPGTPILSLVRGYLLARAGA